MWYGNQEFHTVTIFLNKHVEQKLFIEAMRNMSMTANYNGMPSSHEPSRTTESVALKSLPAYDQKWYDAIEVALDITSHKPGGDITCELIEKMYFITNRRTLVRASQELHISDRTASRRKGEFLSLVLAIRKGMDDK